MIKFFKSFTSREKSDLTKIETFRKTLDKIYSLSQDEVVFEKLPQLLNLIIQLLLEEDREYESIETSPCTEYFLNNRVMEKLCKIAINNNPQGIFQLIVNAISRIIQHMKPSMMGHASVHKPLVELLSKKQEKISFMEQIEIVKLINSITIKLKESPMLTKLFWSEKSKESNDDTNTYNDRHFVLWKRLDRLYRGTNDRRLLELVRKSILKCIIIDDSCEEMQLYLSRQTKFMKRTVNELNSIFKSLLKDSSQSIFRDYIKYVHFSNELCKIVFTTSVNFPNEERFSYKLIEMISDQFFDATLIRGLMSNDDNTASIYTAYITETLNQIDAAKLSHPLIKSLVNPNVFSRLLSRIENHSTNNVRLPVNTLNLMSTLISLHNHTIETVNTILFENLECYNHEEADISVGQGIDCIIENIHHLNLDQNAVYQDIITYCEHFRTNVRINKKFFVAWNDYQFPPVKEGQKKEFKEKRFLLILLKKFEQFMENSSDYNLAITELLTTIAKYPHKNIQLWFFNRKERSLMNSIIKLSQEMKTLIENNPSLVEITKDIRHDIENDDYMNIDKEVDENEKLAQQILILNEFMKEFVSSVTVTMEFLLLI